MKTKIEKSSRKNREEEFLKSCIPAEDLNLDFSLNLYADGRCKNAFSMPVHFLSVHNHATYFIYKSESKDFSLQIVFENSLIPMIQKEIKLLNRRYHSEFIIRGTDKPGFECMVSHYSGKNMETVYDIHFLILDREKLYSTLKRIVG